MNVDPLPFNLLWDEQIIDEWSVKDKTMTTEITSNREVYCTELLKSEYRGPETQREFERTGWIFSQ